MKYFVTTLSPSKNMGTMNWQTMILSDYCVNDSYWEKAKRELSEEVQWVTQIDLYKKIKWNHDSNDDIILSKPVSIILETVKSDFPHANVWVYQ
ncbi:hypothetical protein LLI816_12065 (plasmid) [Lactococcus lactis subsp. lactis]|uniref:hypothetical protein n=1 Tax=Lactococcus TaxID=1357 RepID=UPI00129E311F|nr:hypothetical protein [Lactococcus lactis]MCT3103348.1 hypothetical protein [Lactococcus lactis]MRL67022.1 hypothetical protein [Lactococcus lactis subsp. lactis]QTP13261.2 hypothetical protein LLDRC3_04295 [Lactococcus lactis subsp. lactis]